MNEQHAGEDALPAVHLFLESFGLSGGQRIIALIANGLAARGRAVTLHAPGPSHTPAFALHPDVRVAPLRTRGFARLDALRAMGQRAAQVEGICVATRQRTLLPILAGVLHRRAWRPSSGTRAALLVQHLSPLNRRSATMPPAGADAVWSALARQLYQLPVQHIVVSDWLAQQAGLRLASVIPNAIDPDTFFPEQTPRARTHPMVLGAIARQTPLKGFDLLQDALRALDARQRASLRLRLVLWPGDDGRWLELPADLAVERVRCEHDAALRSFYQSCDMFVFSSRLEGFGLPPLEAMACGAPVITTDCGGVRMFAEHERTALVVPLAHGARGLARAIARLLDDEALARALRERGLARACQLTPAHMIASYDAALR